MTQKLDRRTISRKLRPKQRLFIGNYTDPSSPTFLNGKQSAISAGYSEDSAAQIGSENLTKPNVREEVERCLEDAGVTRQKAFKRLDEALDGERTVVFCTKGGDIVYSEPLIDHKVRLKAIELAARLRGDFAPEVGVHLTFNLSRRIAEARQRSGKTVDVEAQQVVVEEPMISPKS